jgi:hypothetical protein
MEGRGAEGRQLEFDLQVPHPKFLIGKEEGSVGVSVRALLKFE